jgi:chemotaxis-related protein WspD
MKAEVRTTEIGYGEAASGTANKIGSEVAVLTASETAGSDQQLCWKQIGVWGSSTCEKLLKVTHCHDCSVYATAGAQLLQRAIPAAYRAVQTAQVAAVQTPYDSSQLFSVIIFRLAHEWLALPAKLCQQILAPISFHTLPHRSNATLLGIVNVRGQLLLKVSLFDILGLDKALSKTSKTRLNGSLKEKTQGYPRMIVIEKPTETGEIDTWVFDADELYGIHSVAFNELEAAAAGVSSSLESCTRYVFLWQGKPVNFLNDIRLFDALRQRSL